MRWEQIIRNKTRTPVARLPRFTAIAIVPTWLMLCEAKICENRGPRWCYTIGINRKYLCIETKWKPLRDGGVHRGRGHAPHTNEILLCLFWIPCGVVMNIEKGIKSFIQHQHHQHLYWSSTSLFVSSTSLFVSYNIFIDQTNDRIRS